MPSALELAAFARNRQPPDLDRLLGNVMVDRRTYLPVGLAVLYFEASGVVSVHAAFGQYFRQYPKDILAGMAPVCQSAVTSGVKSLHAIADEDVPGSADLLVWLGGEKTGERSLEPPIGDVFEIKTDNPRMTAWLERRG